MVGRCGFMPLTESSDNSQSSLSTITTTRSSTQKSSGSEVQRSSSGSSSGYEPNMASAHACPERMQRRKLLQMISNYDQQNKQLHRELAKEKRRRTEELACVVKSLLCFESKLKSDMKTVNQRLLEKDAEICRLVRQNRALRKRLESDNRDEGMVADQDVADDAAEDAVECLVLEALQCNNCRKQFYDIELRANSTQRHKEGGGHKDGSRTVEHCSSSDDTLSSSFYGARRSVRYTSKRTPGTFRDYMRSRAMNIDDPALEQQSEENTSNISREDSQTSYEQLHNYARAMERMHGMKPAPMGEEGDYSEHSSLEICQQQPHRSSSRASHKSSASSRSSNGKQTPSIAQLEEDDGIFSPTQDDEDFDDLDEEEQLLARGAIKIVQRRCAEFSEASPKQIYETSTDDWYASASDQEEQLSARATIATKCYGQGAVNPVLECVNQILLQQSMEDTVRESPKPLHQHSPLAPKSVLVPKCGDGANSLPRRSSLSGRSNSSNTPPCVSNGRKRVHFSTKNSMVHVPRHDDEDDGEGDMEHEMISHYHPMVAVAPPPVANETLNYESIYSNEYEPIGSERASNLYVDMDSNNKNLNGESLATAVGTTPKLCKVPPALPPKPANLLKFKKSLQQLDEVADEADCAASTTTATEPDYCSISEVGVTSVQIVADIHKAPTPSELELEVSTVASDDTFAVASQKTEEIEEIFADIPKLPNVAAIIAPKQAADYLVMAPKTSLEAPTSLCLQLPTHSASSSQQYKRKHVPNILAEINKRMSLPNSPTTPIAHKTPSVTTPTKSRSLIQLADASPVLPLQAEFDWYNLDAEYGKTASAESPKAPEGMLEEISEDNECADTTADEYNLDEEFNLHPENSEVTDDNHGQREQAQEMPQEPTQELPTAPPVAKAKKIKKNLVCFEKFIEGSGMSTKPLPSKRKIYFSGPFV
ncbi:uncharacterized protein LOC115625729 isoform X2 [Scaptodrosophila lebanonensis]|uniref:Uncharacterized protein LOC115625729 isoform X2 n=1 Tax=Drosophila lebanonensis TaxID=7225 RepID=A0A6J2TMJ7_DROLE|nr:uncharacterized protein LOC115625729 isoform X2 [Scaptodrosophila lebanonensis]